MTAPGTRVQPNHATALNRHPRLFNTAVDYLKGQGITASKVLSYGCSTGEEPASLSELYFPQANVVGVDIVPEVVEKARSTFGASHPRVTFDLSTPEAIRKHGPFDAIFAMSVLCRIDCKTFEALNKIFTLKDFAAHIELLDSVLKPGGVMVILNGNYSVLDTPSAANYTVIQPPVANVGQFLPIYRPDGSAAAPPYSTAVVFAKKAAAATPPAPAPEPEKRLDRRAEKRLARRAGR